MNQLLGEYNKKIPKKKRKITELYFSEYDDTAEIYTYNTKLKNRLAACAAPYSQARKDALRRTTHKTAESNSEKAHSM